MQQIVPTQHLDSIKLEMVTKNGIECPCSIQSELIENPETKLLIRAKLQMAKRKLFCYI